MIESKTTPPEQMLFTYEQEPMELKLMENNKKRIE